MAPRRGGSGSGSGDSSGCGNCSTPLYLFGSNWKHSLTTALFVIECIVILVLIVCLVLASRFKWTREMGRDRLRNSGYLIATTSSLIYYILHAVDIALAEEETVTTYSYYITQIFSDLGYRVAALLILAIIFRTIAESSVTNLARKLHSLHSVAIGLLTLLTTAAFGLFVAQMVMLLQNTNYYDSDDLFVGYKYVSIVYEGLYLLVAILVGIESSLVMLRARSKPTLIMVIFVSPALFLRSLFSLVSVALVYFSPLYYDFDVLWASSFICDIANMLIFVGVVSIGYYLFKKGNVGKRQQYGAMSYAPATTY